MRPAGAKGLFVVIEGPEGAGKSTQIARLAERLQESGRSALLSREPGGTQTGDAIREILLDPTREITPLAEFLLYSASRAQLVEEVIAPALNAGTDVLCDRFASASVAYQGHGRGLDLALIDDLNQRATGGLTPDLTVLLDIEPVAGLARAARRSSHDRLEAAGIDFHRRVREGFLAQARGNPSWLVIDASTSPDEVAARLWNGLEALINQRAGAADGAPVVQDV